jgi:NAD(P)-dependent dehydrogenase (short-subunit alcohol dehydrogenase family)
VGVGPGNGAALARRFSADGYAVALLARSTTTSQSLASELAVSRAYACDVGDGDAVQRTFDAIRTDLGEPEVVVFNAGPGAFTGFDNVTAADFEASWRVNALGAFLVAKQVTPAMKKAGKGAIIFIGATASRRGGAMTTGFAPAKAAQRSFAEGLAKALWPAGVHVSVIILDGIVDLESTRKRMSDKPDDFFLKPADLAATASWLAAQPRSAWAFEVEARPFGEKW